VDLLSFLKRATIIGYYIAFRGRWKVFMENKGTRTQFILILTGAIIVVILAFRYIAPFGAITKSQMTAAKRTGTITKVKGITNAQSLNGRAKDNTFSLLQQVIRTSVATFQLKLTTSSIDGIWLKLRFMGNPKEITVGVRGSTKEKYFYTPLYNQALENLTWNKVTNRGISLWQKESPFTSFDAFVKNPPKDKIISTYFVDPASLFMNTANGADATASITTTLRGSHTLYTTVTKKPFILTVYKQDANGYIGADTLSIQVYKGSEKLAEQTIPDDGITLANSLTATPQKAEVRIDNPDLGVYKIVLKDNSNGADVRITSVAVNQPKLVIASPIFPMGSTPATLFTNSSVVQMVTYHLKSVQTVRLDDRFKLDVLKENQKYAFHLDEPATGSANVRDLHTLILPLNDLILSGDGFFAVTRDAYFNPQAVKTVDVTKISNIEIADYVVGRYAPVIKTGDWMEAQVFIDPKNIKVDADTLYFSLESPDLDASGGEITVDTLSITTTKPSWFGKTSAHVSGSWTIRSPWHVISSWLDTFVNGTKKTGTK